MPHLANCVLERVELSGRGLMLLQRADNQYSWEYPDTPELPKRGCPPYVV